MFNGWQINLDFFTIIYHPILYSQGKGWFRYKKFFWKPTPVLSAGMYTTSDVYTSIIQVMNCTFDYAHNTT